MAGGGERLDDRAGHAGRQGAVPGHERFGPEGRGPDRENRDRQRPRRAPASRSIAKPLPVECHAATRQHLTSSKLGHEQPEARIPDAGAHAVRHRRRHPVPGTRDRRQRGHLLAVRPDAAARAAGAGARSAGQPDRAGAQAGEQLVQQRRRLRRGVQLRDVPRPAARRHAVQRHRRAPRLRREPRLQGPADPQRPGHARLGQLFPRARRPPRARPPARARGRSRHRRIPRRRPQLRLLADAVRPQSQRPERTASRSTARA